MTLCDSSGGGNRNMVRKMLRNRQKAWFVECIGRGPGAVLRKRSNKEGNKHIAQSTDEKTSVENSVIEYFVENCHPFVLNYHTIV